MCPTRGTSEDCVSDCVCLCEGEFLRAYVSIHVCARLSGRFCRLPVLVVGFSLLEPSNANGRALKSKICVKFTSTQTRCVSHSHTDYWQQITYAYADGVKHFRIYSTMYFFPKLKSTHSHTSHGYTHTHIRLVALGICDNFVCVCRGAQHLFRKFIFSRVPVLEVYGFVYSRSEFVK